jgi:hypothetical protein
MKCSTSRALHLILRVLAWITRKIAKGCGAFMGQSERLDAGKTLLPGQWTVVAITPGVGTGEGASPHPAGTRGKPCPGTMNFWCEPVGLSLIAPRQGSRPFSEEVDD